MKVSMKTKLSYGVGAFGKDFAIAIVYIYLMYYYTDVVGISAAVVGTLFLFARLWDAINDPIMGWIISITKTRWGRLKPWILIGTVINSIALFLLFSAHHFHGDDAIVYAAITYVFWGMSYTLMDIPFWSMVPTITLDRTEREKLVPYPRFFASLAWLITAATAIPFIKYFSSENNRGFGFQMFTIILIIFFIFSTFITLKNVTERYSQKQLEPNIDTKKQKNSFLETLKLVFKNDQLLIFLFIALSFNLATNIVNGFAVYYFKYVMQDDTLFPYFLAYSGIIGLAVIVFFSKLVAIFNRRIMWFFTGFLPILSALLLLVMYLMDYNSVVLVVIAGSLFSIGNTLFGILMVITVADTVDYGECKLGIRCESIAYSVQTLVVKAGSAFSAFIIGIMLSAVNYVPNQIQSSITISGMAIMMIAIPSIFFLITLILYFWKYKLKSTYLAKIQEEMQLKYQNQ